MFISCIFYLSIHMQPPSIKDVSLYESVFSQDQMYQNPSTKEVCGKLNVTSTEQCCADAEHILANVLQEDWLNDWHQSKLG